MFSILKSIRKLFRVAPALPQDRDDRYLADAADLSDLELRLRQIDSGRSNLYAIGAYGILMR